jgi:acyl carrier protein
MTGVQIRESVIQGLQRIAPEADFEKLAPGEPLRETLDIDSFDFLRFLVGLNEELGVEIPESDYGQLTTLENIVAYLSARCG